MFKAKAVEIVKCNHCGEEITNDTCQDCSTWFEAEEYIFCDELNSHYCKKCGEPRYKKYKAIGENSTLDDYS